MQVINRFFIFGIVALVGFFLFTSFASAALVPCGNNLSNLCTTCDFFKLADNVKNFLLFKIIPPVGVLFVVIAGFFILTAGAKPDHYTKGKKILKDLVWGLLIIFGAWMITNTFIKLLASESDISASWYKIECKATSGVGIGGGPGPGPDPGPTQKFKCNSANVCVADPGGIYTTNACGGMCTKPPVQPPGPGGGGLCSPSNPGACGNSQCSQWTSTINQYAGGVATANVLKSIMFLESSCNPSLASKAKIPACGLMQIQPPTARLVARYCGVDPTVIGCNWLKQNPKLSICLAAAYLNNTIRNGSCGSNQRHLVAGYHAGPGNCVTGSCSGASCDNSTTRKWECRGHPETQAYVKSNLYCIGNPGF